jgi:hypothetical protein
MYTHKDYKEIPIDWDYRYTGDVQLYEITRPFHHYVLSSALIPAHAPERPETYLFMADETGKVLSWTALPGSLVGELDHHKAITNYLSRLFTDHDLCYDLAEG